MIVFVHLTFSIIVKCLQFQRYKRLEEDTVAATTQEEQKYELSERKFGDLWDTINTTCDIDRIEQASEQKINTTRDIDTIEQTMEHEEQKCEISESKSSDLWDTINITSDFDAIEQVTTQEEQKYDLSKRKFGHFRDAINTTRDIDTIEQGTTQEEQKDDLSTWKFTELQDTINTNSNIDTIEQMTTQEEQKYDLSTWKFTELQDTINTNSNIDTIEQMTTQEEQKYDLSTWKFTELQDTINTNSNIDTIEQMTTQEKQKKYDLSTWKFAELRDTINNTSDNELYEACRHEYHRRLKVYHAWKARHSTKTSDFNEDARAPQSVIDAAKSPRVAPTGNVLGARHRYFRVPFVCSNTSDGRRGWWYAHFDGQYVARQMALHPDQTPVLLQAGVDDIYMCEVSLEESGLTRARGAEILQQEFEREWRRHSVATQGHSLIESSHHP